MHQLAALSPSLLEVNPLMLVGSFTVLLGLPSPINLTKLEETCDGIVTSFKWPHRATSVVATVYDDYGTILYYNEISFNSTNFTGYNIPKKNFTVSINHISLLGLNSAGPGSNATASIFIPRGN